jgi:hypothetical protein
MVEQITEILIKSAIFSIFSAVWFYANIIWNKCVLKKKTDNKLENNPLLSFFVILILLPLGILFLFIFNLIGFFLTEENIRKRYTECLFLGKQCIYN